MPGFHMYILNKQIKKKYKSYFYVITYDYSIPGIVVFRKLQSDAFLRLQTFLPLVLVIFSNYLESYESIALKLAKDEYAWFPHVYSE